MNPYETPQTIDRSTRNAWWEFWLRWRETLLSGAVGLGLAAVEIYFLEQGRHKKRDEQVQQVMQQAQLPSPPQLEPLAQP